MTTGTATARRMNGVRGFSLIELLIVVSLLGILAAIVIPRFSDASTQARAVSVSRQLQILRQTIERYRIVHDGTVPPGVAGGTGWDELLADGFLMTPPANPLRASAHGVAAGPANPGEASGAAVSDGWYWNTAQARLYAIDDAGTVLAE